MDRFTPTCDVCGGALGPDATWQAKRHPGECQREFQRRRQRAYRERLGEDLNARRRKGPWRGDRECRFCGATFAAESPRAVVCYADACQRAKHAERQRAFQRRRCLMSYLHRCDSGISFDPRDGCRCRRGRPQNPTCALEERA